MSYFLILCRLFVHSEQVNVYLFWAYAMRRDRPCVIAGPARGAVRRVCLSPNMSLFFRKLPSYLSVSLIFPPCGTVCTAHVSKSTMTRHRVFSNACRTG